jgi:CheY-like chemotaxis protein
MHDVAGQFAPLAASRGLGLKVHGTHLSLDSDRRLLRRVLQNYLANALRYTQAGRVVLGARRRDKLVEIQVWDSGPGIPEHHLHQIFVEFQQFEQPSPWGERGLGLGLSICQRISRMLDHPLQVRSWPGRGSMFSISVPLSTAAQVAVAARAAPGTENLFGLRVLCLDNDREILDGMRALLERWRVTVDTAETVDAAIACVQLCRPDVLLVDYHLHDRLHGLDALDALREACGRATPGALLTADGSDALKHAARARGYPVLTKPIKPASLRAYLTAQRSVTPEAQAS